MVLKKNSKKILIVVAHPDDETIGMGGTIRSHVLDGDEVSVISMTDGVGSRNKNNSNYTESRKNNSYKCSKILGFEWLIQENFKDNSLDSYSLLTIIKSIEIIKNKIKPEVVYTHSSSDLNIDHRIVTNAVLTAFRPQPKEKCKEIRLFEVASATDYGHRSITGIFTPNLFIDIKKTWSAKEKALMSYGDEIKKYPHSRSLKSIRNLSMLRGNQVGLEMCEAFEVIRKIQK